eukprot:scaffold98295_cov41-Attheya_sp.AAC.2
MVQINQTWIPLSHLCACHFNRKNQSDGITQDKTSGKRPDALVESPSLGFLGTTMCRMLLIPIRAPLSGAPELSMRTSAVRQQYVSA